MLRRPRLTGSSGGSTGSAVASQDHSTPPSRQAWSLTGRRMLTHSRVLAAVIVISISALAAIDQYGGRMASDAIHRLDVLTAELASIPPPPGLTLYKQTNQTKPGQALTAREYVGATSYGAARTYYDAVLADRGFVFVRETTGLQSPYACYQRGDEKASVEVPGEIRGLGPVLLVTLSWGLSPC